MAVGNNTTGSFADSLQTIIDGARIVREYPMRLPTLAESHTLPANTGLDWNEIALSQLTAQDVTETTELDNPQQIVDTLFSVTPVITGIQTIITRRAQARVAKATLAQMGSLKQNAIERKKDEDGLAILDASATSFAGAGTTLTSGHISAAVGEVRNGTTNEPSTSPIYFVGHSRQIKDVQDEVVAGVGTYAVPSGLTESTFRRGFQGSLFGAEVFVDDNISIDASDDAKGGVFAREGVVYVQGMAMKTYTRERPEIGGGADEVFMYDEFAYGERLAGTSGGWVIEIYSDATQPTS